jgi:hypothetical protein
MRSGATGVTTQSAANHPTGQRTRIVLMIGVVAVLVWPVVVNSDDYPLSTYPMYSSDRRSDVAFVVARGLTEDGDSIGLGLQSIGSSDDSLVVAGELRAAIRRGDADSRCREIAGRVAAGSSEQVVSAIEIVTETRDVVKHARGEESLVGRTVNAACSVAVESG